MSKVVKKYYKYFYITPNLNKYATIEEAKLNFPLYLQLHFIINWNLFYKNY